MTSADVKYQLEPMSVEALNHVFPKMKRDFIPEELKPQALLAAQMESGMVAGWLLLADGEEAGYAFVLTHQSVPYALLDFLAVERRGQGDGSAFLHLLQEKYPQGMLAEVEDEVPGDAESENELRRRRMHFYQRAGFRPCPFDNEIFGVRYLVHLWLPESASDEQMSAAEALDAFYRIQIPEEFYRDYVRIALPGEDSAQAQP